jgi:phage major head subunit gpT-like protein
MIETRGNWTDLVGGVGLEIFELFDQGQEEYTPGISQLLITGTGTGAQETYTGKTGAGRLRLFDGDGEAIGNTRRHKLYTTKVVWNNYGTSIEVSANQIDDRDYSSELDEAKDLGVAANFSQDESGFQLFNGGFATTTLVRGYNMSWYGDAKPWFSTVHPTPVPGASTQSNASSTGITFGDDNLEVARLALTFQNTDDGIPLSLLGSPTLVVPAALEKKAEQVTMSELVSENANNAINFYKGSMSVVSAPFLDSSNGGSATAWYLMIPGRAKAHHTVRQAPTMNQDVNILNKVTTFAVDARWANHIKDWRRAWGSKGDGAAYSS